MSLSSFQSSSFTERNCQPLTFPEARSLVVMNHDALSHISVAPHPYVNTPGCEWRTATRGDACVLFWTLGGNQVGRAAIIGWQDVLAPAMRAMTPPLFLWPFHGTLADLHAPGRVVV